MYKKMVFVLASSVALMSLAGNYVAFVDVGGAVEDRLFNETVTNAIQGAVPISAKALFTNSVDISSVVAEAAKGVPSGERKLSVYFVDSKDFPPQVTAPGRFAIVNMRGLKKDADAKLYRLRVIKMAEKGLAFACGFGANQDIGRCVMSAGSFDTLKGIDSTSASYSPFCYFPMSDYLQKLGLICIPQDEEEVEEE